MKQILSCLFPITLCCSADELPVEVATNPLPHLTSLKFKPSEPESEDVTMKIEGATTAHFPTHDVTILRGEASTAPDLPEPLAEQSHTAPSNSEKTGSSQEVVNPIPQISITVHPWNGQSCQVEIFKPHTQTNHVAWCAWDVSLLVPIHEISLQGKTHALSMMTGLSADTETDQSKKPILKPGSIMALDGDDFTSELLVAMREVHDKQFDQLVEQRAAREKAARDAEAWSRSHPAVPQDQTIWIRPHRGSRYLEEEGGGK